MGVFTLHINFRWISNQLVEGSDGKPHRFQHPVVLTLLMFLGEFLCFAVYKVINVLLSRRGVSNRRQLIRLNYLYMMYIYSQPFSAEQEYILTRGTNQLHPLSMLLPSLLRTIASILLFTGLFLTYATSFQMIRGLLDNVYQQSVHSHLTDLLVCLRRCTDLCWILQYNVLEPNAELPTLACHFYHDVWHNRYFGN